jgi:hypothetical protein
VTLDVAKRVADRAEVARFDRIVQAATNDDDRGSETGMPLGDGIEKGVIVCAATDTDHTSSATTQTPDEMGRRSSRRADVGVGVSERIGMLQWRATRNANRIVRDDRSRRVGEQEYETGDHSLQQDMPRCRPPQIAAHRSHAAGVQAKPMMVLVEDERWMRGRRRPDKLEYSCDDDVGAPRTRPNRGVAKEIGARDDRESSSTEVNSDRRVQSWAKPLVGCREDGRTSWWRSSPREMSNARRKYERALHRRAATRAIGHREPTALRADRHEQ